MAVGIGVSPEVRAFARTFEERLDEFSQRTVERIFDSVGAYREASEEVRADAFAHTRENLRVLARSLAQDAPITREDFVHTRLHAARRVQRGVKLEDFLEAFLVGHRAIWEIVLEELSGDGAGERAAVDVAGALIRFFNVASANAAATYLEAQQLLLAEGDRHRRDLLEDLLAGAEPQPGPGLATARAAGLGPDQPFLLTIGAPLVLPDTELSLRAAAQSVGRAGRSVAAPLVVMRRNEIVVIRAVQPADVEAVEEALRRTQAALAQEGVTLAIGVSTVRRGFAEVPAAYREARAAVDHVGAEGGVLSLPSMTALEYLTRRSDETAARLIPREIVTFIEEDRAAGGTLTATLTEYAACDMNATLTAERLHLHANTARYRLARISERTGRDLRCLSDVMELVVACELLTTRGG